MKIIYLHQYFKTASEGGSLRSYYLAKALVADGHSVEMITSHNETGYKRADIEGISVHYLPVFYDNALGFADRVGAFFGYVFRGCVLASKLVKSTPATEKIICYASSTPLTVGLVALYLKFFYKVPYFFEVRDLWPLAPIEMGYIKSKPLQRLLYFLEKTIYKNAGKIVVLSPGMAAWVAHYNNRKPVILLPNMADCDFFDPTPSNKSPGSPFVVTYSGTLGEANQLERLVDVAAFFQQKGISSVVFQIVGKGKQESILKARAVAMGLTNLHFLPHTGKKELRELLRLTDAVYVSFAQKPVLETTSPNKFFDGLAAGKLIITNTGGWVKDLIEAESCGFYAENPENFYQSLRLFLENPDLLQTAQRHARTLAQTQFDRKRLSAQFCELFR